MSKVTSIWYSNGQGYERSCGHGGFNIGNNPRYKVDDEIPCDSCADIAKSVKAARVEGMEKIETLAKLLKDMSDAHAEDCPEDECVNILAARKYLIEINKLIEAKK